MPESPMRSPARAKVLVVALSLVLAAAAGAALTQLPLLGVTLRPAPWWVAVPVAIGYYLAERLVFHIEFRDEAVSFSVSEVPTAFALVFLDPVTAVVVRTAGCVPAVVQRGTQTFKTGFNAAVFAAELVVAYAVVGWATGGARDSDARLVAGIALALFMATAFGTVVVTGAIACFRGGFGAMLAAEARTAMVTVPSVAVVAAVAVTPALVDARLAVAGLVPVLIVWYLLAREGRLQQRFGDLARLYDFTRTIARSLRLEEIAASAVAAAAREMRAERGTLIVEAADGGPAVIEHVGGGAPPPTGPDDRRHLEVPVCDALGRLGVLRLAGRMVAADHFDDADVARAERLADQLAATLRNAVLHAHLEYAALHDSLTGDLNRRGFDRHVGDELRRPVGGSARGLIVLDLDRFKEINDNFGHQIGDAVLVEFADRVRALLDPGDVIARLGGDEFVVFAVRPAEADVTGLADRIVAGAHAALQIGELQMVVTASAGVSFAVAADDRAEQLLRRADVAMYAAKRTRVGHEVYRPEMDRRAPERLARLADLRAALDDGSVGVHYQPKIDIAGQTVVGAEALVRWFHPTEGPIDPAEFVRVAEESGLIRQLTDQVLRTAIREAAGWSAEGLDLGISVNLSTLDLVDDQLAERIEDQLDQFGLAPERLTLEVTESSLLVDTPRTMASVRQLCDLGVHLSLDDFGTGYSSLSYLRRLPAVELKVDRSFVSGLLLDPQDEVIVRSTIELGHQFGMRVVAEGIENTATLDRLAELGCDLAQGYGISRPLPADLFTRWLRTTGYRVRRCDAATSNVVPIARGEA